MELSNGIKSSRLPCINNTGHHIDFIVSRLFHPIVGISRPKNPTFSLTSSVNDLNGLCRISPPTGMPFCIKDET